MSLVESITAISDHLQNLRTKITELQGQEDELIARPIPSSLAVKHMEEWVNREAQRFVRDNSLTVPMFHGERIDNTALLLPNEPDGTVAALCFLFGDAIKEKLGSLIKADIGNDGLSDTAREKAIREVREKRRKLEHEEEQLIRSAEKVGMAIDRRPDADPAIILSD